MKHKLSAIDQRCEKILDKQPVTASYLLNGIKNVGFLLIEANQADGECYAIDEQNCEEMDALLGYPNVLNHSQFTPWLESFLALSLEDILQHTGLHGKILAFDEVVYFCAGLLLLIEQGDEQDVARLAFASYDEFEAWAVELIEFVKTSCGVEEEQDESRFVLLDGDEDFESEYEEIEDDLDDELSLQDCKMIFNCLKQHELLTSTEAVIVSGKRDILQLLRVHLSDRIVSYPSNYIQNHQRYQLLLEQHVNACQGDLQISDCQTQLDDKKLFVTLTFNSQSKNYRWTFKQTSDWVNDKFWDQLFKWVAAQTQGQLVMFPSDEEWIEIIYLPKAVVACLDELGIFEHK